MRLANLIPPLLPFSRGIANKLRGYHHLSPMILLSSRTISDIWMWRATFHSAISDAHWLSIPVTQPLLFRYLDGESDTDRSLRQSTAVKFQLYADVCTSNNHGLGGYLPSIGWFSTNAVALSTYIVHGDTVDVDINVLEFIAAILTLTVFIQYCILNKLSMHHMHVQLWTDNTSCKSWLTTHRSEHPLHCFLLQAFGLLQTSLGFSTSHLSR